MKPLMVPGFIIVPLISATKVCNDPPSRPGEPAPNVRVPLRTNSAPVYGALLDPARLLTPFIVSEWTVSFAPGAMVTTYGATVGLSIVTSANASFGTAAGTQLAGAFQSPLTGVAQLKPAIHFLPPSISISSDEHTVVA